VLEPRFRARFLRHWLQFALRDAHSGAFGRMAALGSAIVFVVAYIVLGASITPPPTVSGIVFYALASIVAAWMLSFIANIVLFSLIKAYHTIEPFLIWLNSADNLETISSNTRKSAISINLSNRATIDISNCSVYISKITGFDDDLERLPWLIDRFDLSAKSRRHIEVVSWFCRNSPEQDDEFIRILAKFGGAWAQSNMLQLSMEKHFLSLEVHQAEVRSKTILISVWFDATLNHLRAETVRAFSTP